MFPWPILKKGHPAESADEDINPGHNGKRPNKTSHKSTQHAWCHKHECFHKNVHCVMARHCAKRHRFSGAGAVYDISAFGARIQMGQEQKNSAVLFLVDNQHQLSVQMLNWVACNNVCK